MTHEQLLDLWQAGSISGTSVLAVHKGRHLVREQQGLHRVPAQGQGQALAQRQAWAPACARRSARQSHMCRMCHMSHRERLVERLGVHLGGHPAACEPQPCGSP